MGQVIAAELPGPVAASAADRVYRGVMRALEEGKMVPGQRLVEPDLAAQFDVGRNAVREAMQRLAMRGVVDLSPHRSASIRSLGLAEAVEVLDVAASLTALLARSAAAKFDPALHGEMLAAAMEELASPSASPASVAFSRARRGFYRTLLSIAGNRELQRIFPAIGMHIVYSQYQSLRLFHMRHEDYRTIYDALIAGDRDAAERAGREHVEHVRTAILQEAV